MLPRLSIPVQSRDAPVGLRNFFSLYRIISEKTYISTSISLHSMAKADIKSQAKRTEHETSDPVLLMLGIGRQLWKREPGDKFVERLRSEDDPPPFDGPLEAPAQNVADSVWRRIERHQGEGFKTVTDLPFTYAVEGAGIWFFRDGRRVNRKLTRTQVEVAIARCPLTRTTEIKDLMDYPYLFALLSDARIRGEAW